MNAMTGLYPTGSRGKEALIMTNTSTIKETSDLMKIFINPHTTVKIFKVSKLAKNKKVGDEVAVTYRKVGVWPLPLRTRRDWVPSFPLFNLENKHLKSYYVASLISKRPVRIHFGVYEEIRGARSDYRFFLNGLRG
jgi:hypothetical protein